MKAITNPRLKQELVQLISLARRLKREAQLGVDYFFVILYYVSQATDRINTGDLNEVLQQNPHEGDSEMATIAQMFREEGFELGKLEKGLTVLHNSLIHILPMLRFGPVSADFQARIRTVTDTNILFHKSSPHSRPYPPASPSLPNTSTA